MTPAFSQTPTVIFIRRELLHLLTALTAAYAFSLHALHVF